MVDVMILSIVFAALGFSPKLATPSYDELLAESRKEMHDKDHVLTDVGLPDPSGRFDVSQDTGEIIFSNKSGAPTVKAHFEFLGTLSTISSSWLWAWANPTIDERLTKGSRIVRDYGQQRGFARLTTDLCRRRRARQRISWRLPSK